MQQSQRSIDLSPSLQYSRAALRQLKESSQSPKIRLQPATEASVHLRRITNKETAGRLAEQEEMNISDGANAYQLCSGKTQPRIGPYEQNQQLMLSRKLSNMLDASPLKNSYIGKIIHDRYQNHLQQPDGGLTLSSILNETLIMLKGRQPNKPLLEPLPSAN